MSGPALKKVDSHAAIHEAALNEARELTELLARCLDNLQYDKASEVAYVTLEHWETRTLAHAAAEEEGLYKEMAEVSQEFNEAVIALTRDHDILRRLAEEIKGFLSRGEIGYDVLNRFQALILVDDIHNHDEEKWLSVHEEEEEGQEDGGAQG